MAWHFSSAESLFKELSTANSISSKIYLQEQTPCPDEEKQRGFFANKPILKEWLKEVSWWKWKSRVKKSLLMKVKEENKKAGLKLNIQKTTIMASGPITSWHIDGETMETVKDIIFLGSKITEDCDCSHDIKRYLLLGRKVMTNLGVKVTQSCLTICNLMDYTVHGILQAKILEWVAFPFSRGSSQSRDSTQVSHIAGGFVTSWATREIHDSSEANLKWSKSGQWPNS